MKITPKMNIVGKDSLVAVGDVVLDDLFVIHDVKVIIQDGEGKVFFPRKAGTTGWSNIVEVKPEAYKEIKDAVLADVGRSVKEFAGWSYDMNDLQIEIKPYDKGELRGFATLTYQDTLTIKGIQIREKNGELSVLFPYTKQKESYTSIVGPVPYTHDYFDNLKDMVLTEYQNVKGLEQMPIIPEGQGGMSR